LPPLWLPSELMPRFWTSLYWPSMASSLSSLFTEAM
jgi:hypothetical protein